MIQKLFLPLLAFGTILSADYSEIAQELEKDEMMVMGEKLYKETCVSCHGVNGETNPQMQLIVKPRKLAKTLLTKSQSFQIIKHGAYSFGSFAAIMPTFKHVYNDDQIASLAYYISENFNKNRDTRVQTLLEKSQRVSLNTQALGRGENIFQKQCAECHGSDGRGDKKHIEQLKREGKYIFPYNLTKTLLSEDQIFLYAKYGGHFWGADKKDMPSWKDKYSDAQLQSVAKYIKEKIKK